MKRNSNTFLPKENASAAKQSAVMAKEKPSINESKESSPQPTQTRTPKPSATQTSGSKPSSTHPAEEVEETPKTFADTQTTQTQQEAEVNTYVGRISNTFHELFFMHTIE